MISTFEWERIVNQNSIPYVRKIRNTLFVSFYFDVILVGSVDTIWCVLQKCMGLARVPISLLISSLESDDRSDKLASVKKDGNRQAKGVVEL